MDFFQLLPGSAEDGRFIGAASTVERMIFVNRAGERFIAEDSPSSKLSAAVLAQPGGIAFPILDANGYSAMRTLSRAMFDRALMRGDAFEANSIPELASLLQIPAEALVATAFFTLVIGVIVGVGVYGYLSLHFRLADKLLGSRAQRLRQIFHMS